MESSERLDCPSPFECRWARVPAGASVIDPSRLPSGFRAAGVPAGIKPSGRSDFALLVSDAEDTVSAARFTASSAPAAPVQLCRTRVELGRIRACVVNSGNANAATGKVGLENAFYMQGAAAMACGVPEAQVAVASTGVIGRQLDRRLLAGGGASAARQLDHANALAFAEAICTTDRWIKAGSLEVALGGGKVVLSAQVKGAGMIAPAHVPHATLLAFIETDAVLEERQADDMLGSAVKGSFDRVSVDGQLSTNDSVFLLANGASGVAAEPGTADEDTLREALEELLSALALSLVRDGEGAGRIGRIDVVGGDPDACERVARAVADSPLVKTALAGGDPNWGRIIQAAGMALATGRPEPIDVIIEGVPVATAGIAESIDLAGLERAVDRSEVEYSVRIPGQGHQAVVYFSDLGHDYVSLNAEYTT